MMHEDETAEYQQPGPDPEAVARAYLCDAPLGAREMELEVSRLSRAIRRYGLLERAARTEALAEALEGEWTGSEKKDNSMAAEYLRSVAAGWRKEAEDV